MGRSGNWEILEALGPIILTNIEGCIVEIGAGLRLTSSTKIFCDLALLFKRKFYCCELKEKKTRNLRKLFDCGEDFTIFQGPSLEFMKKFSDDIALMLIDGEHTYWTVEQEVNFFLPKLVTGGVMFIHDTLPPKYSQIYSSQAGDVYLARQELEKREDLYVFTWPYTAWDFGLTMVMKKEENAPWYRR